jgi:hypothetical protein
MSYGVSKGTNEFVRRGLRFTLCAALMSALLVTEIDAQAVPLDTAGLMSAMLKEYRTPNGPIVEIAAMLRCGDARLGGWQGRSDRCTTTTADSVIVAHAREHDLTVVKDDDPMPQCRWSSGDLTGKRGLRVELHAPAMFGDVLAVGLTAKCIGTSRSERNGFFHSVVWEIGVRDGAWKLIRIKSAIIT